MNGFTVMPKSFRSIALQQPQAVELPAGARSVEPPVDLAALRELLQADEAFERQLVDTFATTGHGALAEIQQALDHRDAKRVERAAHSLKGAAGSLFATSASAAALRLEIAARSGMGQPLRQLAEELRGEFARAVAYLQARYSGEERTDAT